MQQQHSIKDSDNEFQGLCTIVDNTGSMGQACTAACSAAKEIQTLTSLLFASNVASFAVYGDYDSRTPDHTTGGFSILDPDAAADTTVSAQWFSKYMRPMGGGGAPEAQKTGFHLLLQNLPHGSIVFHYTDAPPHPDNVASLDGEGKKELKFLQENQLETNWDSLCATVKSSCTVVTFLTCKNENLINIYTKMGSVVVVSSNTADVISKTMLKALMALIGQKQDGSVLYMNRNQKGRANESTVMEPFCHVDLRSLLNTADPKTVIDAFDSLLDPSNPISAMCLDTNPVLGKYWRLICGRFKYLDDGMYEKECQGVMDKLSQCKCSPALSKENADKLKAMIDASHDESPLIRKWVASALEDGASTADGYFLVCTGKEDETVTVDDIRNIGRGGDYSALVALLGNITKVQGCFTLPEATDESPAFIPLNDKLSGVQILRLLANLICPGTLFLQSEVAMIAVLGYYQKDLKGLSMELLAANVGDWIKFDVKEDGTQAHPTFWSLNFMRLLKLCPDKFLTRAEIQRRDRYLTLSRLIRNHDSTMEITLPLIIAKLRQNITWKRRCSPALGGCGQNRCFTIFPGDSDVCGLCIVRNKSYEHYEACEKIRRDHDREQDASKIQEASKECTHWAQCFACKACYAVVQTEALNVRPKCHYCRLGMEPPVVECMLCLNKYVSQAGSAESAMADARTKLSIQGGPISSVLDTALESGRFVCPGCSVKPQDMIQNLIVKLVDLIADNPGLINLVPVHCDDYELLMEHTTKFWKRAEKVREASTEEVDGRPIPESLAHRGYAVHNVTQVIERFTTTLATHSGVHTCPMCIEDVPVREMVPLCGYCPGRVCKECVRRWYSNCVAGAIAFEGNCKCPFCKSVPKYDVIKGLALSHFRNHRVTKKNKGEVCKWDPSFLYGACTDCLMLVPALERECARASPDLSNFCCDNCKETRHQNSLLVTAKDAVPTKRCPSCGIEVEKNGGCNHITCPTTGCGAHWCWDCVTDCDPEGMAFDPHTIYDHMASCGGIFAGNEDY